MTAPDQPAITLRDHCTVTLIDAMGDDTRLAGAAWVSTTGQEAVARAANKPDDVPGVIGYLMKHRHGTPFEAGVMQFFVHAPIFVWREWHRHRIASYNEESARYKTLDPVFYVAPAARPSRKVDGWKPGRPKFDHDAALNERVNARNALVYQIAYEKYLANLADGADPGFARDCLPVGIFSSCWVTVNVRALMGFLSLRTFEADAAYPSYPLYEIDRAAREVERHFAARFPLTHAAFQKNGRVAP